MKLIGLLSLVALAYGYENDITYIRMDISGGQVNLAGVLTTTCASPVVKTILVKPIPATVAGAEYHTHFNHFIGTRARHGTCMSFALDTNDIAFEHAGTYTKSAALYDLGSNKYAGWTFAATDCMGAATQETEGFVFTATSGSQDCAGTHAVDDGVGFTWINGNQATEAKGTRFISKRALVGDLIGPFTTESCNILALSKVGSSLPVVVPLEAATAAPTDFNEPAVSEAGICYDIGQGNNGQLLQIIKGATPGQLTLELSSGGSYTNRTECEAGGTVHRMTYTAAINGSYSNCVQAVNGNGSTVSGMYWKFEIDDTSVGEWASFPVAAVPACPAATPSPAAGLKVSVLAAALIALVAMAM